MLFGQDLDGGEVGGEAGAAELVGLLVGVALGDEDEAVAGGEVGEGIVDVGEEFDLLFGDGLGEADDAACFSWVRGASVSCSKQLMRERRKLLRP